MRNEERASQMWSVLAFAARNRQVLTYGLLSKLTGMHPAGVGGTLEPIQSYCLLNDLPPLTALVVNETTGQPGVGFIAAHDLTKAFLEVFSYDWIEHGAPTPDDLASAVKQRPSNGVRSTS